MRIRFTCPTCAAIYSTGEDSAGRTTKCNHCGTSIVIPRSVPSEAPRTGPAPPPPPQLKECPFCSERILATAKKCKHCGEVLDVTLRAAEEARRFHERSSGNSGPVVVVHSGGGELPDAVEPLRKRGRKSRSTAAMLAIFGGFFGLQKFYLGYPLQGILCVLFCWTLIPLIIGVCEGLSFLGMSKREFDIDYN